MLLAVNPVAMQHRTGALTFQIMWEDVTVTASGHAIPTEYINLSILKYFKHVGSMLQWKHVDCRWDSAMNHWLYWIMLQGIVLSSIWLVWEYTFTCLWVSPFVGYVELIRIRIIWYYCTQWRSTVPNKNPVFQTPTQHRLGGEAASCHVDHRAKRGGTKTTGLATGMSEETGLAWISVDWRLCQSKICWGLEFPARCLLVFFLLRKMTISIGDETCGHSQGWKNKQWAESVGSISTFGRCSHVNTDITSHGELWRSIFNQTHWRSWRFCPPHMVSADSRDT